MDRGDNLRIGRVGFNLFPEQGNVLVQGPGGAEIINSPYLVQDIIPGEHLFGMITKQPDQPDFPLGYICFSGTGDQPEAFDIQGMPTETDGGKRIVRVADWTQEKFFNRVGFLELTV